MSRFSSPSGKTMSDVFFAVVSIKSFLSFVFSSFQTTSTTHHQTTGTTFYFGIRVVLDVRANTDFVHCTNCHEQDNQWRFGRHAGACCRQKAKSGFNWSKWTNCWLPNDSEIHQHAIGWGGTVNERLKAFPTPCVAKVQHPIAPCQWQKAGLRAVLAA